MTDDSEASILFRPALINTVAGLVLFAATASVPALFLTWSNLRTLDQRFADRATVVDERCHAVIQRVQRLEEFRADDSRFRPDGERIEARLREIDHEQRAIYRELAKLQSIVQREISGQYDPEL